jgi:predicted alpha-1,2-mannosidase
MRISLRLQSAFLACLSVCAFAPGAQAADDLAATVNTFIGTKDEGNTFPGASAPFGQIQVSPIGDHYAGWRYDDAKIRGFGHSFLSGAGCWGQGGLVSVLPFVGTIGPKGTLDTTDAKAFDQKRYAAGYTHDGEVGQAGYYKVRLGGGIDTETTALTHAGAERYTFSQDAKEGHILVNIYQATERHPVIGAALQIVGDRVIEGREVVNSFCGGRQYTTWFRLEFDRPFKAFGTFGRNGGMPGARSTMEGETIPAGAWLSFDLTHGRSVTVLSAISHVDHEGARKNLAADGYDHGKALAFDTMRRRAQDAWRKELAAIRIKGGTRDDAAVFYTSLYHALLQPLTGSDTDGRYRGYDDQIHTAGGWTYYEFFSLWDTYRSQNQLLAMLRPERARDIARTMLAIDHEGGWLPRWGYANFDTNTMTGDPVTPFLVDLWRYGALAGREKEAYTALRKNAFEIAPMLSMSGGRTGNANYLAKGYVQYDRAYPSRGMDVDPHHGGSATYEYALGDCALSQMANALGEKSDAATLAQRGRNWRNLWDANVVDKATGFQGFPRPKNEDGSWYTPPQGDYDPRSDRGFHEGTAWQYQWLTQQDAAGLVEAIGGKEKTAARLDAFFAYDAVLADPAKTAHKDWVSGTYDYYSQFRYNPNNEPDLHAPWMYTLIGEPWKTAAVLRAAQTLFTNGPGGVTGNDDLGEMSAWYLFSAVGLYPAAPGTGELMLHTPRFPQIHIALGNGKAIDIIAAGADGTKLQYVSAVSLDGQAHPQSWLSWDAIKGGAKLHYDLTATTPTQGWGTQPQALPSSPCAAPKS